MSATGQHEITGRARPKISADAVKIYSEMPPGAKGIGKVSAQNPDGFTQHWHPELKALKRQAGSIGTNGIFVSGGGRQYFVGESVSGTAICVP
jgi:hypothetical protein